MTTVKVKVLGSFRTRTFREALEKAFQKVVEANAECVEVADHFGKINLSVVVESVKEESSDHCRRKACTYPVKTPCECPCEKCNHG